MANADHVSRQIDKLISERGRARHPQGARRRRHRRRGSGRRNRRGQAVDRLVQGRGFHCQRRAWQDQRGGRAGQSDDGEAQRGQHGHQGSRDGQGDDKNELRKMMKNTAEASEQAKQLLTSLNCRFGGVAVVGPNACSEVRHPQLRLDHQLALEH